MQPYKAGIATTGETSLMYFGGRFSHAVRRSTTLAGPDRGADHRVESPAGLRVEPVSPSRVQLAVGACVVDALPLSPELLSARVDFVPDSAGERLLIGVELTEPQLFLAESSHAASRLAQVIADWAIAARGSPTPIRRPGIVE